jgi:hypothetical protein
MEHVIMEELALTESVALSANACLDMWDKNAKEMSTNASQALARLWGHKPASNW